MANQPLNLQISNIREAFRRLYSYVAVTNIEKVIEKFLQDRPLLKDNPDLKYVTNLFYDYVLANELFNEIEL